MPEGVTPQAHFNIIYYTRNTLLILAMFTHCLFSRFLTTEAVNNPLLSKYNCVFHFAALKFVMRVFGPRASKKLSGCQPAELTPKVLIDEVRARLRNIFINLHKT